MSLNLFNYRGIFWIHIYTYNSSQRDKVCKTYICISSTNNGDDVTRQYNYISFQEAEEIENLKYTTINRHKICVLHVIIYYMYIFSKEKQLNTEHGVYLIDISIFLVLIHQTWKSFSRDNINPLAKRKRDLILNIRRKIFRDV